MTSLARKVAVGRFYIVGQFQNIAAGASLTTLITNPATSGRLLTVVAARVFSSKDGRISFVEDATFPEGDAVTPWNPNRVAAARGAASAMEVSAGDGAPTGGTVLPMEGRVYASYPYTFEGLIVVQPGKSLGARYTAPTGLAESADVAMSAFWVEDQIW